MTAPQRPDVDPYDGPPPTDLVVEDIAVGDGAEAGAGQTVTVHYVGVAHSTGEEFDASWNRGEPFASRSAPVGSSRAGTRACRHEGRRTPPARRSRRTSATATAARAV